MRRLFKSSEGDTIVEVLIAIMVAATMLGLSLGTMNRNLRISQRTKEQSQAVKYAQGQLEILKASTDESGTVAAVPSASSFCFTQNGSASVPLASTVPKTDLKTDDFSAYTGACSQVSGGADYKIVIQKKSLDSDNRDYKIYVRWDEVGGTRSQVTYAYRTAK